MTPCIIESPYAGDVAENKAYLQECIRWCLAHGYTPYASHQMLTEALDDTNPEQRKQGLDAGLAMSHALAGKTAPWFWFIDRGVSRGMAAAYHSAAFHNRKSYAVSLTGKHAALDTGKYWVHPPGHSVACVFDSLWTPADGWEDLVPQGWVP